jgi:hypothetical protein
MKSESSNKTDEKDQKPSKVEAKKSVAIKMPKAPIQKSTADKSHEETKSAMAVEDAKSEIKTEPLPTPPGLKFWLLIIV